ncbi:GDSL lipase/esterase [Arabidopsis thaliana x Arabidopsis arenosa]|jgi:phospholipase/lecithinase/hemolysin|uniref:GDSL lipase/esterase n=1 Tax=Arabidopsis thaliana x Arabidopsis arenosa TaxID=1240361 RepID=A0A8T2FK59_9BRAS|nr:GDSL lipase/esterase [Arabidopsis thaliana x Arabidopsis arenosa]
MAEAIFKALLLVIATTAFATTEAALGQRVPCYFVFGDSVFDNGNNNVLNTSAKVNYSPYGIDFARGPTGRFSNGRNIPDIIAELMRFSDYIPPFTGASPEQAHIGINYASGGGGIREETSQHLSLYVLGARKVAVFGVSKLGCTPRMIASHGGGNGCAAEVNKAVEPFNKNLKALVYEFNRDFADAKFTFVDIFSGQSPFAFFMLGFRVTDKSCCTVKPGEELCATNEPVCPVQRRYVYWDNVHSTEAANMVVAKAAYAGLITSPYSLSWLARL